MKRALACLVLFAVFASGIGNTNGDSHPYHWVVMTKDCGKGGNYNTITNSVEGLGWLERKSKLLGKLVNIELVLWVRPHNEMPRKLRVEKYNCSTGSRGGSGGNGSVGGRMGSNGSGDMEIIHPDTCLDLLPDILVSPATEGAQCKIDELAIGDHSAINAVDVFGIVGQTDVCFIGAVESILFEDASNSPRTDEEYSTFTRDGYTCATIPSAGTVIAK